MPRFSANLSFLYTEVPFLDRFQQRAKPMHIGTHISPK